MAFVSTALAAIPSRFRPAAALAKRPTTTVLPQKRLRRSTTTPRPHSPRPAPFPPSPPSPPAPPARRRKPHGYWNDLSNLQRELAQVVAELGHPPRTMPRIATLQRLSRGDVLAALNKHGGLAHVMRQLRWTRRELAVSAAKQTSTTRRPATRRANHFWRDERRLREELHAFVAKVGREGQMPTRDVLLREGRSDLVNAAALHGGLSACAEKMGLVGRVAARKHGYWRDFANVQLEVMQFPKEKCKGGMPTAAELAANKMSMLSNAISMHGGFRAVADRIGLQKRSVRRGAPRRWSEERVVKELWQFLNSCMPRLAKEGTVPSECDLRRFGRNDLSYAISKYGGYDRVAKLCGLKKRARGVFGHDVTLAEGVVEVSNGKNM